MGPTGLMRLVFAAFEAFTEAAEIWDIFWQSLSPASRAAYGRAHPKGSRWDQLEWFFSNLDEVRGDALAAGLVANAAEDAFYGKLARMAQRAGKSAGKYGPRSNPVDHGPWDEGPGVPGYGGPSPFNALQDLVESIL